METNELFKKVRKIEIKTRGLTNNIFSGQYHSAFKGRGMTFSEVREYQYGDDIRNIDWNVTARFNRPFVKIFEEEREMTVMLLIDVSGSRNFGTLTQTKRDMMAEVAATLAFSTIANNDKVGVIFFSDKIEKYIPAKKGKQHVLHIIRDVLSFEPVSNGTNIAQALEYFTNAQKRRCTAFIISDMIGSTDAVISQKRKQELALEKPMMISASKHDMHVIQIYDHVDTAIPDVGLLKIKDAETQQRIWIDTSVKAVRDAYAKAWQEQQTKLQALLNKTATPVISIQTNEDYVKALMRLFKMQ